MVPNLKDCGGDSAEWSAAGAVARKAARKALASVMVTAESAWSSMMKRAEAGSEQSWV